MLRMSSWKYRFFLWRYLPAAAWLGVRIQFLDDLVCTTRLTYSWFNRNPFGSIYFAAQSAAAEMATGLPAFLIIRQMKAPVNMLITDLDMSFVKQARGTVYFRCEDLDDLRQAIRRAIHTDDPISCRLTVHAVDAETGEPLSEGIVVWRFRRRRK